MTSKGSLAAGPLSSCLLDYQTVGFWALSEWPWCLQWRWKADNVFSACGVIAGRYNWWPSRYRARMIFTASRRSGRSE